MAEQDPSFLSTYGITNPWSVWLLARQSELLAEDAGWFHGRDMDRPICPKSVLEPHRMVWRPGEFVCYMHDEPVRVKIEPRIERAALDIDVLHRTGEMLDYVWEPGRPGGRGRWKVVRIDNTDGGRYNA